MNYNTHTLDNGLRIIHLPSEGKVVYCGYQINAGTRHEQPGEEGLAHFCEHTTFKGTERRRAWHVLNCLESVGGELNAYTNKEETVYYAAILRDHMARAVDLLSDIVFHSVYPQTEIDKEVEVICDEIESYNDSPAELIYDDFENILFQGHPLGHNILGTAERVRSFKTADALRFTRKHYRPDNAVFFACGDIDFRRLVQMLRKATATCGPGMQEAQSTKDVQKTAVSSGIIINPNNPNLQINPCSQSVPSVTIPSSPAPIIIERGTHQAHVMVGTVGYNVFDDRRMALYLLNNILGGPGMNARLNLSLRERHGLVYTVESSMVSYADTGVWSLYFGCDAHDVDCCLRLVRKELDRLISQPLSDTQLRMAKKQIKGQIGVACDHRENYTLDFGKSYLHYGWLKDTDRLYRDIDQITAPQIQAVAQELFTPERLVTVIYK